MYDNRFLRYVQRAPSYTKRITQSDSYGTRKQEHDQYPELGRSDFGIESQKLIHPFQFVIFEERIVFGSFGNLAFTGPVRILYRNTSPFNIKNNRPDVLQPVRSRSQNISKAVFTTPLY